MFKNKMTPGSLFTLSGGLYLFPHILIDEKPTNYDIEKYGPLSVGDTENTAYAQNEILMCLAHVTNYGAENHLSSLVYLISSIGIGWAWDVTIERTCKEVK